MPDCWTAYGATDDELPFYGSSPRLGARRHGLVAAAQVVLLLALVLAAFALPPGPLRWLSWAIAAVVALSAIVSLARLARTAAELALRRDHLVVVSALGGRVTLPWDLLGEIGLVTYQGRQCIGLRLRPEASGVPAPRQRLGWLSKRLTSDYHWLLPPANGDAPLLGRVLFRYCIDARARRSHLPTD